MIDLLLYHFLVSINEFITEVFIAYCLLNRENGFSKRNFYKNYLNYFHERYGSYFGNDVWGKSNMFYYALGV